MVALSLPTALLVGVGAAPVGAVPAATLTVSAVGTVMATSQTVAPSTTTTGFQQPYGQTNAALHVSDGSGGQTQCLPVAVNLSTTPAWQQPNYVKFVNLATQANDGFAITMPNHIQDCTTARTTADVTAAVTSAMPDAISAAIGAAITTAANSAGASYGTGGTGSAVYLPILAAQYAGGYATGGQTGGATAAGTWASTHPASAMAPGGATVSQALGGAAAVGQIAGAAYLLATAPFLPPTGTGQDCASLSSSITAAKAGVTPYGASVTCGSGFQGIVTSTTATQTGIVGVHYAIGLAPAGLGAKALPTAAEIAAAGATLTGAVTDAEGALTTSQSAYYQVRDAVRGNFSSQSDAVSISTGELVKVTNGGAHGTALTVPALSNRTGAVYGSLAGYGDLVTTDIAVYNIPVVASNPSSGKCIGTGGVPTLSSAGGGCTGVSIGLTDANRAWSDPTGAIVPAAQGQFAPESYMNLGSAVISAGANTSASPTIIRVWSLAPTVLPALAAAGGAVALLANATTTKAQVLSAFLGATLSTMTGYPTTEKATSVTFGTTVFSNAGATAGPKTESNCGGAAIAPAPNSKPINPMTGVAYVDSDFTTANPGTDPATYGAQILAGKTPASVKDTLKSAATLYMQTYLSDINLGTQPTVFAYPTALCAADLAGPTTGTNGLGPVDIFSTVSKAFAWGIEPLYTAAATQEGPTLGAKLYTCSGNAPARTCTSTQTGMNIRGVAFTFPYTSSLPLNVTQTAITYKMPKDYTTTGCTPDGSAAGNLVDIGFFQDAASSTCSNPQTGLYTISDSAAHNYSAGSFLQAPSATFNGVAAAKATTAPACITLEQTTAGITLGAITAHILFTPMDANNLAACIGQIKN